jgi:hypothetical protein
MNKKKFHLSSFVRDAASSSMPLHATTCWTGADPHLEDGAQRYTSQQIRMAWRMLCRGDKDGLRKSDIERAVRAFKPNITQSEVEQLVGPIKGRVTFNSLRSILQSNTLPMVRLSSKNMHALIQRQVAPLSNKVLEFMDRPAEPASDTAGVVWKPTQKDTSDHLRLV